MTTGLRDGKLFVEDGMTQDLQKRYIDENRHEGLVEALGGTADYATAHRLATAAGGGTAAGFLRVLRGEIGMPRASTLELIYRGLDELGQD